jgi:hypothetical protein
MKAVEPTAKGSRLKQWKNFHPAKFGTPVTVRECSFRIHRSIGIVGEARAEVVRSAWFESGGSEETFEATIPQLAGYARKQSAPSSNP